MSINTGLRVGEALIKRLTTRPDGDTEEASIKSYPLHATLSHARLKSAAEKLVINFKCRVRCRAVHPIDKRRLMSKVFSASRLFRCTRMDRVEWTLHNRRRRECLRSLRANELERNARKRCLLSSIFLLCKRIFVRKRVLHFIPTAGLRSIHDRISR